MKKRWKKVTAVILACAMLSGSLTVFATETETEHMPDGQLTLEDLDTLNGGSANVYTHGGRVTFVDGTCTQDLVTGMDDAAAVVDSVISLIGGDADTQFVPWRQVMDPLGNTYYIFQQMYHDTTVCGGAVKVITDADCNMIGLCCSVESELPETGTGEGITADEAQKIVLDTEYVADGLRLDVLDQFTDRVILPSTLKFSVENGDASSRFVWVVYTDNPSGSVRKGSDLPYLAHYVSMSGEYLYNMPAIAPDDEAGRSGYDASYIFEFMEPADYTGYVDLSDGTEKEITVTVMRDRRTGMYYLGNLERRIVVGQCYDFLYGDGQVVLESSQDNMEWDQVGLLSLYNYCRAWDYYHDIGWDGADGEGTPIIILNNFCDDHYNEVNNACYVGRINGMQAFLASKINDFSQCLDIIAHEFTHCVTGSLMTYNSYMNDYGAINEGMSDCQGKNCEMMAGDVDTDNWILGANSVQPARSMSDPRLFQQPAYTWDEYYIANAKEPGSSNDHGGVHFNSSLMNQISYILVTEGGMTLDEARTFWFMVDASMVPGTDYEQLAELLPAVLRTAGMEQYAETLDEAIARTRLADKAMPETMDEEHAMLRLQLPGTEAFDAGNWMLMMTTVELDQLAGRGQSVLEQLMNGDFSFLPESVQKIFAEAGKAKEEAESKDWKESLKDALLEGLSSLGEESRTEQTEAVSEEEEADILKHELMKWLQGEIGAFVFSSYGFAGQDGSTMNMVVRPGRGIPMLQHQVIPEGSDRADQVVMAIFINGKWYDVGIVELMEEYRKFQSEGGAFGISDRAMETLSEIMTDVLGENMENLDIQAIIENPQSVLDLFTVDIRGGEILELSPEGLDRIVIPEPTPPSEKMYGTIEPGRKSRPKAEAETEAETGALDDAA